jgi:hypothetical protein
VFLTSEGTKYLDLKGGYKLAHNVVRIQEEMIKPGVLVRGGMIDIYINPPRHSVWYPHLPKYIFMDDPDVTSIHHPGKIMLFEEGGIYFRFASLGLEVDGYTLGDIDFLMSLMPASELFADDLEHFARMSQERADVFRDRSLWAALAVYEVDIDTQTVEFCAWLELSELPLLTENI